VKLPPARPAVIPLENNIATVLVLCDPSPSPREVSCSLRARRRVKAPPKSFRRLRFSFLISHSLRFGTVFHGGGKLTLSQRFALLTRPRKIKSCRHRTCGDDLTRFCAQAFFPRTLDGLHRRGTLRCRTACSLKPSPVYVVTPFPCPRLPNWPPVSQSNFTRTEGSFVASRRQALNKLIRLSTFPFAAPSIPI
jgi:hypothetical protein